MDALNTRAERLPRLLAIHDSEQIASRYKQICQRRSSLRLNHLGILNSDSLIAISIWYCDPLDSHISKTVR